jgi:1,2-phenylacetyl-CoA epoxidase PaaB subunit
VGTVKAIGAEPVFEVFARHGEGEPLRHVGCVAAPDAALARVYARRIYDEESWSAMYLVPRDAVIAVESPRAEALDAHA